jgi:hypothetical protein
MSNNMEFALSLMYVYINLNKKACSGSSENQNENGDEMIDQKKGKAVFKLNKEAIKAVNTHVETMRLPLAKLVVATLSGKQRKSEGFVEIMRSMEGAAMIALCDQSNIRKIVTRIIEEVNGAVTEGTDALEVLARMTKEFNDKLKRPKTVK